jgi:ABC-2 type transport system ATP-binding protein
MNTKFTKLDWKKTLLAGAAAIALSLLIPTIVISLYAMILAIAGQGAPDTARLNRFANLVGGWGSQIVVVLAAVRAAMWAARKAGKAPWLHGAMTGVTAAIGSLIIAAAFGGPLGVRNLIVMSLEIFAGWLGGWLGGRLGGREPRGAFGKIVIKPNPAPGSERDEAVVVVENLRKSYGELNAVDGVSFEVRRGEVFGLLGPNGAGKTTTVEIIEGLRRQDSGGVLVCGFDPKTHPREVKQRVGVGMQTTALPDQIEAREALELFASFYRWRVDVDELLATVSLEERAESRYCKLSGGQQQRLCVALALVNDPAVVILDEPTAGLDPQSRRELYGVIARMRDRGRTVILTTHYIEEAEKLCDRVAIIDHGRIIATGSPRQLIARSRGHSHVEFSAAAPIDAALLRNVPFADGAIETNGVYRLRAADVSRAVIELIKWLESERNELVDLRVTRPSLEDVFIELTGRKMRE